MGSRTSDADEHAWEVTVKFEFLWQSQACYACGLDGATVAVIVIVHVGGQHCESTNHWAL